MAPPPPANLTGNIVDLLVAPDFSGLIGKLVYTGDHKTFVKKKPLPAFFYFSVLAYRRNKKAFSEMFWLPRSKMLRSIDS